MTNQVWSYSLFSVILISLISVVGIFFLSLKESFLKNILIYFVSFSAGALFGDVFIHLLPEAIKDSGFNLNISLAIIAGITISLLIEKIICWRHCHLPINKNHIHRYAYMNLYGDMVHNLLDGLTIVVSYLVNIPVGIATTIAVIIHEIPQEVGDFGVLLHGGFSKKKAIIYNFFTATTAIAGALIGLSLNYYIKNISQFLVPFAAGNFIYIAGADLIPELHKETNFKKGILQLLFFLLGIIIMLSILLIAE